MSNIESLDGRSARRAGSRRKLLIAGLRLIEKGNYRPKPIEITAKAEMHERSFHSIFGDVDTYMLELLAEHESSIRAAINADVRERGIAIARIVLLGKRGL